MKKVLFFGLLLLAPAISFAQQSSFSIGVKGGVNLSKLTMGDFITTRLNANGTPQVGVDGQVIRDNIKESFNSRMGWAYGIYTRFGRNLYIQPELMVSTKGGSFNIVRVVDGKPIAETISIKTTNFDVPILVGLKGGPIRVVAGPIISFRINDERRLRESLRAYTSGNLNDGLARATYGYQLGIGVDILRFGIDVRYEGSLSDVASVNLGTNAQFSQRQKSWQVTLAYKLF